MTKTTSKTVRWAIIGASQIARSWVAGAIKASNRGELVSLMSRDLARGEEFARGFDIPKVVTSLSGIWEDSNVDAVYISTANARHREIAVAAAAAGKHVLCEKPLSLNLNDAVEMAEACDAAGVIMGTNHHMRAAATHLAVRNLVRSGAIGKPLAARAMYCEYLPVELQTWRTTDPDQGGVIYDLTVHNVDALRFALGLEPQDVMSMKASSLIGKNGVEDQTQSIIRFGDDLIAYSHEGYAFAHHETALEIHGSEGGIYGRGIMDEAPGGKVYLRRGKEMTEIPTMPVNLYEGTVSAFNAAVLDGGKPAATGWDGVQSLATALAVRESCRTGQKVTVPQFAGRGA